MKKQIITAGLLFVWLLCSACGKKEPQLNVKETGEALMQQGSFEDTMSAAQDTIFEMLYYGVDMSTVQELSFYMSTGATAEEITVAKCVSEEAAKTLANIARERVDYLKESFADYVPKELTKLENPVLRQEGVYVILCISADDSKAAGIVDQQLAK